MPDGNKKGTVLLECCQEIPCNPCATKRFFMFLQEFHSSLATTFACRKHFGFFSSSFSLYTLSFHFSFSKSSGIYRTSINLHTRGSRISSYIVSHTRNRFRPCFRNGFLL